MAEIQQPTPIKPAWPVSRDDAKRRSPKSGQDDKKKKKPTPRADDRQDDGHPHIDDYA